MALLKIQVFDNVTPCRLVNTDTLRDRRLITFKDKQPMLLGCLNKKNEGSTVF